MVLFDNLSWDPVLCCEKKVKIVWDEKEKVKSGLDHIKRSNEKDWEPVWWEPEHKIHLTLIHNQLLPTSENLLISYLWSSGQQGLVGALMVVNSWWSIMQVNARKFKPSPDVDALKKPQHEHWPLTTHWQG